MRQRNSVWRKNRVIAVASTIYLRDQKVSLDELGPALDLTKKEGRSIVIKADRLASYDLVMAVTNAALEHGITSVALATAAPPP